MTLSFLGLDELRVRLFSGCPAIILFLAVFAHRRVTFCVIPKSNSSMNRSSLFAAIIALALLGVRSEIAAQTAQNILAGTKPGILVELFTSEGCSSCPPADALLKQLDAQASKTSNQIVVLGEHVDYWDGPGWHDRFSSHEYTDRQEEYARRLRVQEPYTPEMVVDGSTEFTGNDVPRLQAALREAASRSKALLRISAQEINPAELSVNLDAGPLPSGSKPADLYLALADNQDETKVGGGENSGRSLQHVAVVRSLQKVGKVAPDGAQKQVKLRLPKPNTPGNLRLVAFVQESGNGPVLAAAVELLGEPSR